MNDLKNQSSSIRELQKYLYFISLNDPDIPKVVPDGIYGSVTRDAVTAFQKKAGLPATGVVDKITWDAIVKEYNALSASCCEPDPLYVFPSSKYVVKVGERSDTVSVIQIILRCLSGEYAFKVVITVSGVYTDRDARAVKVIQQIHGLEQSGCVDVKTWNAIASDYRLFCSMSEY